MDIQELVEMTLSEVKERYPSAFTLYSSLPETLPKEEILSANRKNHEIGALRQYMFDGMMFAIPPGVFSPGDTSEAVFKNIINRNIDVRDKNVLVMGCGAGIETILIARNGAKSICAIDIDKVSVAATEANFRDYIPEKQHGILRVIASDLCVSVEGTFDLILFNPPAVSIRISDDPAIVRNTSIGTPILTRLLSQIRDKHLLAPNGLLLVIVSNTAELRKIVSHSLVLGFTPSIQATVSSSQHERLKTFAISFRI